MNQPYSGFRRIACNEPCEIHEAAGARAAQLWNVSVLGAYVVIPEPPAPEQTVMLTFRFAEELTIRVKARVAWNNAPTRAKGQGQRSLELPTGCGLVFLDLSEPDRLRIQSRVQKTYPGTTAAR